jgi:hypothetical protein
MSFDKNGFAFGIASNSGTILLGIVSIIGRLLIGLLILVGKKAVLEGFPRTMEAGQWLKVKSAIFVEKSYTLIKPRIKEVGKILMAVFIISIRKLEMNTGPKIIATRQLISRKYSALVLKSKIKLTQRVIQGFSKNHATSYEQRIAEESNPSMLSADQSVQYNKEKESNIERTIELTNDPEL